MVASPAHAPRHLEAPLSGRTSRVSHQIWKGCRHQGAQGARNSPPPTPQLGRSPARCLQFTRRAQLPGATQAAKWCVLLRSRPRAVGAVRSPDTNNNHNKNNNSTQGSPCRQGLYTCSLFRPEQSRSPGEDAVTPPWRGGSQGSAPGSGQGVRRPAQATKPQSSAPLCSACPLCPTVSAPCAGAGQGAGLEVRALC